MKPAFRMAVFAAVLALPVAPLLAQSTAAQVTGRVSDASGAVIPGANVSVTNVDTGVKRQTDRTFLRF